MTHSTTTARRAATTAAGEGPAYWFYGDLAIVRSPEGALPIIIEHHVGPGAAAPLHVHHDVDDSFYLLSGKLALRCGDDTFVANAGDYVSLPKGVPHALTNHGDEEAVLLQTHDGPAFLNFIRAVGKPATEPRPDLASMDFAAMNRVAGETGQPVLGPPMSADEVQAIVARASV
jgi:mannose-6-phosphate isomerase-like protein (cupin superfamily)